MGVMQINYIQQINSFWALCEEEDLSANDRTTYLALLNYCNKLNWLNPFICHWDILIQYSGTSKNTFYKSMENLDKIGLIKYQKGAKNYKQPKVSILKIENRKGTVKEQKGNSKGIEEEQKGNLNKLLNKETIKLINDNSKLINENLEKWINKELKSKDKKDDLLEPVIFSDEVNFVYDSVLPMFPDTYKPKKPKQVNDWKDCIDKLMRIEKIDANSIIHIVEKVRADDFWKSRFLTIKKLREKKDDVPRVFAFIEQFKKPIKPANYGTIESFTLPSPFKTLQEELGHE